MKRLVNTLFLLSILCINQLLYAENCVESQNSSPGITYSNNRGQFLREASLAEKWDTLMLANVCYPSLSSSDALGELISKTSYPALIKNILNYSTADIVPFLIQKIRSDKKTEIHFCNSFNASEGIIALCYLQIVRGKRWHEYDGTNKKLHTMIQKHLSMTSETFDPVYKESSCLSIIATERKLRNDLIAFLIEGIDQDTVNHGSNVQTVWERMKPVTEESNNRVNYNK